MDNYWLSTNHTASVYTAAYKFHTTDGANGSGRVLLLWYKVKKK